MNPQGREDESLLQGAGEAVHPHTQPLDNNTSMVQHTAITTSAAQLAVNNFVEELEDIFVNTDKLMIKNTDQTIPPGCVPEGNQLTRVYEVLDGKGNPGFLLGRCQEKNRTLQFVLYLKSRGSGVLRLKYYGLFDQHCEIDGAGILNFRQVHNLFGGYTLEDKYKKLLKINLGLVPFCGCIMGGNVTLSFTNLDGTSSGSMSYKSWPELNINVKVFAVHFIPNLDRKAKYMLLASSLLPSTVYWRNNLASRMRKLQANCLVYQMVSTYKHRSGFNYLFVLGHRTITLLFFRPFASYRILTLNLSGLG